MSYHQFIVVDAIPGAVWSLVSTNAEQHGTVLVARRPDVLVAQTEGICYVYALNPVPGAVQRTRLDLAITRDAAAAVASAEVADIITAMTALPDDTSAEDADLARTHHDRLRRLISPLPQAIVAKKAHEATQEQAPLYDVPVVTLANVWMYFFLAGGLFSATLLLSLNWWNIGQRRRALLTPLMIALPWIVFSLILTAVFTAQTYESPAGYALLPFAASLITSMGLIFWQIRQQRPFYAERVAEHGKPDAWAMRNILLTFVTVILGCMIGYKSPDVLSKIWPESAAAFVSFAPVIELKPYQNGTIHIDYPSGWIASNFPICQQFKCSIAIIQQSLGAIMLMMRQPNTTILPAQDVYFNLAKERNSYEWLHDIRDVTQTEVEIEGRRAVQVSFRYKTSVTWGLSQTFEQIRFKNILFIQVGPDMIYVEMDAPVGLTNTADAIFDSLHFVTPAEGQ